MSPHRDDHLDLCAAQALASLDPAEARDLEQHLAEGCPICEAELRRLGEAAALLAGAAPPASPPPDLKVRVLASARSAPAPAGVGVPAERTPAPIRSALPARKRSGIPVWTWPAAAAALAIGSGLMWRASDRLRVELDTTRRQLDEARQRLEERQRELADARGWLELLEGEARVVDLQITPQGSAVMRGRAIYDPRSRRAILVFSNATPPAGSDYELWALRGTGAASLGLIRADAAGRAVVRIADLGDPSALAAFAVSLERAGGSPSPAAPEGPVVMVGKLGGS